MEIFLWQKVFLRNLEAPSNSYYVANGSGKRIWKKVIPETELLQTSDIYNRTFANGSIYVNTDINFFLRRQDPHGEYGLHNNETNGEGSNNKYIVEGLKQILPDVEYKVRTDYNSCEV